jgi:hypothetical protein
MAKQKLSFRQRLRKHAEAQLISVRSEAINQLESVAKKHGIKTEDLAKLLSSGEHKTLRADLITLLANTREAEIERLYNSQMDLPGVDDD